MYLNHNNLKFFMFFTVLSRKQARWAEFLSHFNFKIIHKSEQKNSANTSSQCSDYLIKKDVSLNSFLKLFALESSHWFKKWLTTLNTINNVCDVIIINYDDITVS